MSQPLVSVKIAKKRGTLVKKDVIMKKIIALKDVPLLKMNVKLVVKINRVNALMNVPMFLLVLNNATLSLMNAVFLVNIIMIALNNAQYH